MKFPFRTLWLLTAIAGLIPDHAGAVDIYSSSGPETSLDSMWASLGHLQSLTELSSTHINLERFHDDSSSRFWLSSLGAFGNTSVRNNHPAFHYSAAGGALGYDYSAGDPYSSGILGLSIGQVFGHQKIKEMPNHPDGSIEGDRFTQDSFMANLYGGLLFATGKKSYLITSMNFGFASTSNECKHPDTPDWDTWTYNTALSVTWRYQATKSFAIAPFVRLDYTHADNKQERNDSCWHDDGCNRWDNRGKFDNLALDVGLTLEHTATFSSGAIWTNSISGSFCPDIVRNNPHYTFEDNWWENDIHYKDIYNGSGYPASRQAYKGKVISRFISSRGFSIYLTYQIILRDSMTAHQAALGIAQSF